MDAIKWSNDLLEVEGNEGPFRIRKIDKIIHNLYYTQNEKSHLSHQKFLLKLTEGHEREVFNDPDVSYGSPDHTLNGLTGTMSNILTSGFLYLYNELLKKDLEINAKSDIYRLYAFSVYVKLNKDNAKIDIDPEEFSALNSIFNIIKSKIPECELFNRDWWQNSEFDLTHFTKETYSKISVAAFWRENNPRQHFNEEFASFANYGGKYTVESKFKKYEQELEKEHSPLIYEYQPPFYNPKIHNQNYYGILFSSTYHYTAILQRFQFMKRFFLDNRSIQIVGDKNPVIRKKQSIGGTRRRISAKRKSLKGKFKQ